MCTKSLSCILCGQPNFPNVDALRVSLLKVTARPLKCPICGDELLGLDKLTIHLFGHSLLEDPKESFEQNAQKEETMPIAESGKSTRKLRKKSLQTDNAYRGASYDSDFQMLKMSPDAENSLGPPKIRCSECDVEFRNETLLKMHREVFHNGTTDSQAPPPKGLAGQQQFYCHICPKRFKMKGSLKIHMRVVHEDGSKKLCVNRTATVTTPTSSSLITTAPGPSTMRAGEVESCPAMASIQPQQPTQSSSINFFQLPTGTVNTQDLPDTHLIQIIDPRQLAQVVYLTPTITDQTRSDDQTSSVAHIQPVADAAPPGRPIRGESISLPSSPQQHSHDSNPKQWECDVCHKSFTTKYFLKKHNRLHTGEMPYTCGICKKSFTFQQSYHKHLLYHSDEKPHACSVCGRAFKELSTLHNHERIHSGEKPFACETCGKCFRQKVSYLVHCRLHNGVMPYFCNGCNKSFRYKVSQRTHKCPANPPGTVVRKTGDLLQKLLQSSSITLPTDTSATTQQLGEAVFANSSDTFCAPGQDQMAEDARQTAEYVNRTLDELVKGTYDKLDASHVSPTSLFEQQQQQQTHLYGELESNRLQQQPSVSNESNFPRIENLCLLSPSAFDGGQLEDLEGLKLVNGW
ncbi:zinc finger protein 624-like [Anopheles albimanus]|uniref:C2H2-type domain-containing protein n=1 Tax=Anopheles albimanus TaxID=7167 RepID=A0A182FRL8_ANOAL|nr:zinc finger protein 624-like [Anopheles albimanus]